MTQHLVALLIFLVVGSCGMLLAVEATPRAKLARIAILGLTSAPPAAALPPEAAAFHRGLRELGWIEGQNLTIERRWADGSLERFATLLDEVVRLPVEVLVVPNQTTGQLAQQATTTIPIVIVGGGALAQSVPNLAQPGGNVTGFATLGPELAAKRLELLTYVMPGLTRVAVLRGLAAQTRELQAMAVAARELGVELQLLQARNPTEIDQAVAAAVGAGANALIVFADGGTFYPYRAQLAKLALTHRLSSIFNGRAFIEAGGLLSYGSSPTERWQRLAVYVDKLLNGAKPGDLPIEQPSQFEFVINLKTARALGLTIPQTLLFQATEVLR
jgi:putative ABC transport system substrate-binding protein